MKPPTEAERRADAVSPWELLGIDPNFGDPEAPDEPRPLRRARLIVVNDGIVPEPEPEPGLYPYPLDALDPDGDPGDY